MKKLFIILAVAFVMASCRAPEYIYDKATDEYVTSDEYYARYPEEDPNAQDVILIITIE